MPKKARNYKDEYNSFHGKPEQIDNRAQRNAARAKVEKKSGGKLPTSLEVDHVKAISKGGGNGAKNLRVVGKTENRRKGAK